MLSATPLTNALSLNCRGRLLVLDRPVVMGILNLTPDSFSDGGVYNSPQAAIDHAGVMLAEGATIIV
jgi:dihydropteroate synthase